jgi:hypothetical protein
MSNETSKARERRLREGYFDRIFAGFPRRHIFKA